MDNEFIKPFEKSMPVYICPWCHNYRKYNVNIQYLKKGNIYLVVECLRCHNNSEMKCSCGDELCDKHNSSYLQIKININREIFDITYPFEQMFGTTRYSTLLWEKQKANYLRLVRFLCNTKQQDEIAFVTNKENTKVYTSIDIVLKQYDVDVFFKLKVIIFGITCACEMYNLPIELMRLLCQEVLYEYY